MIWSPRVKPIKIRRLYRYARLGIYDDMLLHDVGWELYARCADIATVADVYREGCVPCPQCKTKITRRIAPLSSGLSVLKVVGRVERSETRGMPIRHSYR